VISALLSRCQVFVLEHHSKKELKSVINSALKDDELLKTHKIKLKETEALFRVSGGDARKLLNTLELAVNNLPDKKTPITNKYILETIQQNLSMYDKNGEMHYDIISAFIKSIRGSDPNAAVYWLARMIQGGEDPKFIARRMIILASEDIGLANPTAIIMANNCFNAVEKIGWPEGRIILSQCAIYLACSQKSNSSYKAINKAQEIVGKTGDLSVPLHLRNAPTKLMKELGYGDDYQYSHNYMNELHNQEFLPEELSNTSLYNPGKNNRENELKKFLNNTWKGKYNY